MTKEEIMQLACYILIKQGYHTPTIILDGTLKNGLIILEEYPGTSDERIKFMYMKGMQAAHEHSIGSLKEIFLISESWMGQKIPTSSFAKRKYVRPSIDPNRKEVLTVHSYNTLTQENTICISEIIRNDREEVIEINKVDVGEGKGESDLLRAFVAGYQGQ